MGERSGYRVRQGDKVSHIFRKQWYEGGTNKELEAIVGKVVDVLLGTTFQFGVPFPSVGGDSALRSDLDISRLSAALFASLYVPPFDSIEFDERCDISDHGLFEIEILSWDRWQLNHYRIDLVKDGNDWKSRMGSKEILAEMTILKADEHRGKGIEFKWMGKYDL